MKEGPMRSVRRVMTILLSALGAACLLTVAVCFVILEAAGQHVDGDYSDAAGMLALYLTLPSFIVGGILGGLTAKSALVTR